MTHRGTRNLLAGALALVLTAGCSAAAGTTRPRVTAASTPRTTKTVTDRDKGTTVTLHVGNRLKVVLANTYWTIHSSSSPAVLRSHGRPIVAPRLHGCVPGAGCGTVTATFTATAPGTATVRASRTTCGEVLRCTGGNGTFKVSVVVKS